MDFLKSLLGIIGAAMLFLVSAILILVGLLVINPQIHAFILHWVMAFRPDVTIAAGLIVFFVAFFILALTRKSPDSSGTYTFEGEKGPIEISLKALEDYISKHFAGKPVAHSVRTRVSASRDKKKIRVLASISVWSEQSLKTAGETVQREITECLKEGLGLDNVESVRISVDRIIASKTSKGKSSRLSPIARPASAVESSRSARLEPGKGPAREPEKNDDSREES